MRPSSEATPRAGQAGLASGCCLGVVALAALTALAGYVLVRAMSRPELGAAPAGVRHGGTPEAIAGVVAGDLGRQLAGSAHGAVVLSERDLTVIARSRNPDPARFHDPDARVRDGEVVLAAGSAVGPFDVVAVARTRVGLTPAQGISAEVASVEVGRLTVPGWARTGVDSWGSGALSLDHLLDLNPLLASLRADLDCVGVQADGVHLGVHRPGTPADPAACAPGA